MKVLVLSCQTGGGHNACGRYIKEELNINNIECDFKDYFDILGNNAKDMAEKIYLNTTKGNGNVFKIVYTLGEKYSDTGLTSPVYLFNKLRRNKLYDYIKENGYDLVICTHLFPAMALTALKKDGKSIKFINVATDYRVIPLWEETDPDYFVIPHISLKDEFIRKGFREDIILPFGISVASSFGSVNKGSGLPNDKDVVLICSGSMGFGKIKEIVLRLLDEIDNVYFAVICANNKELYNDLLKIDNPNLIVKGYVNNINEYMIDSKIVLTKPGGLTSTEVAVIGKPMIHLMPIPGVENYNARFFEDNGLSLSANSVEDVVIKTKSLLNDKNKQEDMIKSQNEVINKNSAKDLASFIIKQFKN